MVRPRRFPTTRRSSLVSQDSSKAPVKLAKVIKVVSDPHEFVRSNPLSLTWPLVGSRTNWVPRWCHPSARRIHGRHYADDHPKRQGPRSGRGHSRLVGERARSPVCASLGFLWPRRVAQLEVVRQSLAVEYTDAPIVLYARSGLQRCRVCWHCFCTSLFILHACTESRSNLHRSLRACLGLLLCGR